MGGNQSTPIPGGGTHGYHVLKVQDKSPADLSKLEAYFDFIVTIQGLRLDRESDTLIEILKAHLDREVKLGVYNIKGRSWREVGLVPNNKWGGQGVIGVSIRFCSFENVSDNIWHILEVYPNSPAQKAGLCSNTDYIIGYEMMEEEFDTFIEQNNRREVKLFVYNVASDKCRDVVIIPDQNWGGEGSLGCGVGTGYLHRIPNISENNLQDRSTPRKSDIEVGEKRDKLVSEFANVQLLPASPQRKIQENVQTNIEKKPVTIQENVQTNIEKKPVTIQENVQTNIEKKPVTIQENVQTNIEKKPVTIQENVQTNIEKKPVTIQEIFTTHNQEQVLSEKNVVADQDQSLIHAPIKDFTIQEPYIPPVQDTTQLNRRQEVDKKSPIPTASAKNLFTTQFSPQTIVSPSSGLPTAPPTEFNLDIPEGTFHHTQQPVYQPDPTFKPITSSHIPSHPSYTAVSPPTIEDVHQVN